MSRKLGFAWLAVATFWTCSEGPATPPTLPDITVDTPVVYAGDEARIRADAFQDTSSVYVAIGGDTVATTTPGPRTRAFTVPPLMTGRYDATAIVDGYSASFGLDVVGLGREPRSVAGGYQSSIQTLHATDGGQAFIAEPNGSFYRALRAGAYGFINVFEGTYAVQIPGLIEDGIHRVKMSVPGASYRPNHVVFDFSPEGASDARVWRTRPSFEPGESLPCGWDAPDSQYTVAEISPSACLSLRGDEVWRNGTERVAEVSQLLSLQFRVARGGAHTILVSTTPERPDPPARSWPVFDASGRVSYVLDRYAAITGAAFSTDGRTIWIVGRDADGTWRLDALDAMTGEVQKSRTFPGVEALLDVTEDRLDDHLYVASTGPGLLPSLHVLAVDGMTVEHSIPAPAGRHACPHVFDGGFLVPGGSDGRIHLVGAYGRDCGWWVWSFDRP